MTSPTALSHHLGPSGRERRLHSLRGLFARMAAAAQTDTARRPLAELSDHVLRDIGLTRTVIDVLDI